MGRRKILEADHVGAVLIQQHNGDADIPGNVPRWDLQHKTRNAHDEYMRQRTTLRDDGFAEFYGQNDPVLQIGDTIRRHLTRPPGSEVPWRPCFRVATRQQHVPKCQGKRYIEPGDFNGRPLNEEEGDIPRGKRHVPPPVDNFARGATELLDIPKPLRHRVIDEATGKARSELTTVDLPADHLASPRGPKLVPDGAARRNRLPQVRAGDKLYSVVEFSPEFAATATAGLPRLCTVDKAATVVRVTNTWAEKDRAQRRQHDINEVRSLPKYHQ